jgi:hypothetical protein
MERLIRDSQVLQHSTTISLPTTIPCQPHDTMMALANTDLERSAKHYPSGSPTPPSNNECDLKTRSLEEELRVGFCTSSRSVGDVLVGEDHAQSLIKACVTGDNDYLKMFLHEPNPIDILLETMHIIYNESRPSNSPENVRIVDVMRMSNLERAVETAAENGHAAAVFTILNFFKKEGIYTPDLVHRLLVGRVIGAGHSAVLEKLVEAEPSIVHTQINHGALPLYEAVRQTQIDIVAMLLNHGADPSRLHDPPRKLSHPRTFISYAAMADGPELTYMLLQRDPKNEIAGTGAFAYSCATRVSRYHETLDKA